MKHTSLNESVLAVTSVCLSGPLVWSAHFALIYGGQHIACTTTWIGESTIYWLVLGTTALALAAIALIGASSPAALRRLDVDPRPPLGAFLVSMTRWLALLSAIGVIWAGTSVLFLSVCLPVAEK